MQRCCLVLADQTLPLWHLLDKKREKSDRIRLALILQHQPGILEAGLDEAGRGCLAGPVVAAAVILPPDFKNSILKDSKQLSHKKRLLMRDIIVQEALAWSVGMLSHVQIDEVNILNASFLAMHEAIDTLHIRPEALLIDGNRFREHEIPHTCIIKGDGKYLNIAAASILAKTCRDDLMADLDALHPEYGWKQNKGYPTKAHRQAVFEHGISPYHRKSFNSKP